MTPNGTAASTRRLVPGGRPGVLATIRRVERDALEINRAWWDGAAAIHGDDSIYDTEALIAGADWLGEEEQTALAASVGSVDGLDVIHVQCHIGFDTISLARRGRGSSALTSLRRRWPRQRSWRDVRASKPRGCKLTLPVLPPTCTVALTWRTRRSARSAGSKTSLRGCGRRGDPAARRALCARGGPSASHDGRRAGAVLARLPLLVRRAAPLQRARHVCRPEC